MFTTVYNIIFICLVCFCFGSVSLYTGDTVWLIFILISPLNYPTHYVLEIYCAYIPTINVFLLLHSLLKGVSGAKHKVKTSFNNINNTTSVNMVVYAQKWAWPRKRAHRISSRSRKK